ncbi:MAG: hypothetical protein WA913_07885, partial [Pricia sp.]
MAGFYIGTGLRSVQSRRAAFPTGSIVPAPLTPGSAWDGSPSSGYEAAPQDPARVTAKPIVQLLCPPRQTVTGALVVGVFAAANSGGTMIDNWGLSHVDFHFEGNSTRVDLPTMRTFERADGSTYSWSGWWVTLTRPALQDGIADLFVEAVPADGTMQSRVAGPFPFLIYEQEFDREVTVAADGSGDHRTMAEAFGALRAADAQHPRITVISGGEYELESGGGHQPQGFCTIEASEPVTFRQLPPALEFDFTRFRPAMDRLRFKGSNVTIDFVETLEFYVEQSGSHHWLDGCNIVQSRGRNDLWRKRPRNIIPSLFRNGAYFTDCQIRDVNDWGDKSPLARGNVTLGTWADALQGARCALANRIVDHSSAPYYANVDALSIRHTGEAATASVSLSGGNGANRTLRLYEDDSEVASFTILNSEDAYRSDTNYTVRSVVEFIEQQAGWTATLLDDTRYAAALTFPGSTNGSGFTKLDAKGDDLVLPTHFDIHSDLYQLPNLGYREENVLIAFNTGHGIDAQNMLVSGTGGLADALFVGNAFCNRLGTLDEGLASQVGAEHSHVMFVHNSLATQALLLRQDISYGADGFCLIANNVFKAISVSGGGSVDAELTLAGNHVHGGSTLPDGANDNTFGGNATSLFVDASGGDFTPAGELLENGRQPVVARTLTGA